MGDILQWADKISLYNADLNGVTTGISPEMLDYWLDSARRTILVDFPLELLNSRVTNGLIDAKSVQDVQIDLVLDKLANPGGIRTVQESNGPSSGSLTFGGDNPGKLVLTSQHRKMLGASGAGRRVARTVETWR